jgi:hypothetical protein
MIKKRASAIGTNIDNLAAQVGKLYTQSLAAQRGVGMPKTGVVANFDPDQRGFLSDELKGMTNVQLGNGAMVTNVLAAHADYGISPGYQNPDTQSAIYPFTGDRQLRPVPGQPTLVYPVGSAAGSVSNSFIRGGKANPYREYPSYITGRALGAPTAGPLIFFRSDATHIIRRGDLGSWWNNSPLPPGSRWAEMNDIRAANTGGLDLAAGNLISLVTLASLYGVPVAQLNDLLPQDTDGNVKQNFKPLPGNKWGGDPVIQADDTYWTGTVRDPAHWSDSWWDGTNHNVDKDLMETWLTANPGARFP